MSGKPESGAENVELFEREGYLEARVGGGYTLEGFKREISYLIRACKDRGFKRLLADVTAKTTFAAAGTLDRFAIGEHAARVAGNQISVAMLGLPNQLDPEEFGVRVAQNRGLKVRVFTDSKVALAWLISDDGKPEG